MIISTRHNMSDFHLSIEFDEESQKGPRPLVFLEFGAEHGASILISVEQLREVQYLIDQGLTDHDRKPAAVIESIPMFVCDANA